LYAVIRTGGKQYRVQVGDVIDVEKLPGDAGAELELEPLLLVDGDQVTASASDLSRARVTATVLDQHRGEKLRVFTYKNKSRQKRTLGHRQSLTRLRVAGIDAGTTTKKPRASKATATKKDAAAKQDTDAAEAKEQS
jgi:large subunit ribosomal protein L21